MSKKAADIPEGYRITELGPLPEEWETLHLRQIAAVKYGKSTPKAEGSYPVIGSGGLFAHADVALIEHPTLVIGRKGTAGKVWLTDGPCWPSDTTFYLEWRRPVDPRFLYGFFQVHRLSGEHAKTTLPSIQKPFLEDQIIAIPPLPEQKKIAAVLSTVQQAKEKTEAVIAALRELKKSLMRHLFTYGPVPVGDAANVRLKETEIGMVPEGWRTISLGGLVTLRNGKAYNAQDWMESGIPIARIQNLKSRFASFNYYQGSLDTEVVIHRGDLLFSWSGSKGTSFGPHIWWGETAVLNQHIFRVDIKSENAVSSDFLFHALKLLTAHIEGKAYGLAALVHVRKGDLTSTKIPVPSLSEQGLISAILMRIDGRIEAEDGRRAALDQLFRTLLSDLMTAKIRVNDLEVGA